VKYETWDSINDDLVMFVITTVEQWHGTSISVVCSVNGKGY
jgi:hypothetical protein